MKCPNPDRWALLSMGLLDETEREALRGHALVCTACGAALTAADGMDADLRHIHAEAGIDHDRLRSELLNQIAAPGIGADQPRASASGPLMNGVRIMRKIARARVGAIGIAAAVLIAATLGLLALRPSAAWADVVRRIERVTSVSVTRKTFQKTDKGPKLATIKKSYSVEGLGERIDTILPDGSLFKVEFALPQRGEWVTLVYPWNSDEGHFERSEMPESTREYIGSLTPSNWAATLMNLRNGEGARELDSVTLDGRRTTVFSRGKLTIWVDAETKLPVRIEVKDTYDEVYEDFRWDEPLAADLFTPVIPAGFVDRSMPDPHKNTASWMEHVLKSMRSCYRIRYDTRSTMTREGMPAPMHQFTGRRYFDAGLGVRTETNINNQLAIIEIYNRSENTWLWISHPTRTFNLVRFKPGEEQAGGWHLTPERWLEGFADLPKNEHIKSLGRTAIAGQGVLGFEVTSPMPPQFGNATRTDRYWIDDNCLLPARCQHIAPLPNPPGAQAAHLPPGTVEMVEENFIYNAFPMDAKLFEIVVPEGYTPVAEAAAQAPN
jgi:outer membrane lipoprotein-sorting protein